MCVWFFLWNYQPGLRLKLCFLFYRIDFADYDFTWLDFTLTSLYPLKIRNINHSCLLSTQDSTPKTQRGYCQESILASCRIQLQLSYRLLHNQPCHCYAEKSLLLLNFYSLPTPSYFLTKVRSVNLRSGLQHTSTALFFFWNTFFLWITSNHKARRQQHQVSELISIHFHGKGTSLETSMSKCMLGNPILTTNNAFLNNLLCNVSFLCKNK